MKRHLKIMAAPKSWPVERKERIWITRPNPGPHTLESSISISLILKLLKYAKTTKETKQIINEKKVLVNNNLVRDI